MLNISNEKYQGNENGWMLSEYNNTRNGTFSQSLLSTSSLLQKLPRRFSFQEYKQSILTGDLGGGSYYELNVPFENALFYYDKCFIDKTLLDSDYFMNETLELESFKCKLLKVLDDPNKSIITKNNEKIKPLSIGKSAYGDIYEGTLENKKFVIKVSKRQLESLFYYNYNDLYENEYEYLIGSVLNTIRSKIPNFVYTFINFPCEAPVALQDGSFSFNCLEEETFSNVARAGYADSYYDVTIIEKIEGDTYKDFLVNSDYNDWKNVILQIVMAISYTGEFLEFTHFDLHHSNIIIEKRKIPVEIDYNIGTNSYPKITSNYVAKIIDFGMSRVTDPVPGFKFYEYDENHDWGDVPYPLFDIYKILAFSLRRLFIYEFDKNFSFNPVIDYEMKLNTLADFMGFFTYENNLDTLYKMVNPFYESNNGTDNGIYYNSIPYLPPSLGFMINPESGLTYSGYNFLNYLKKNSLL